MLQSLCVCFWCAHMTHRHTSHNVQPMAVHHLRLQWRQFVVAFSTRNRLEHCLRSTSFACLWMNVNWLRNGSAYATGADKWRCDICASSFWCRCHSAAPFGVSKCLNNPSANTQRFVSFDSIVFESQQIVIIAHCDKDDGDCMILLLLIIEINENNVSFISPSVLHPCHSSVLSADRRLIELWCDQSRKAQTHTYTIAAVKSTKSIARR